MSIAWSWLPQDAAAFTTARDWSAPCVWQRRLGDYHRVGDAPAARRSRRPIGVGRIALIGGLAMPLDLPHRANRFTYTKSLEPLAVAFLLDGVARR